MSRADFFRPRTIIIKIDDCLNSHYVIKTSWVDDAAFFYVLLQGIVSDQRSIFRINVMSWLIDSKSEYFKKTDNPDTHLSKLASRIREDLNGAEVHKQDQEDRRKAIREELKEWANGQEADPEIGRDAPIHSLFECLTASRCFQSFLAAIDPALAHDLAVAMFNEDPHQYIRPIVVSLMNANAYQPTVTNVHAMALNPAVPSEIRRTAFALVCVCQKDKWRAIAEKIFSKGSQHSNLFGDDQDLTRLAFDLGQDFLARNLYDVSYGTGSSIEDIIKANPFFERMFLLSDSPCRIYTNAIPAMPHGFLDDDEVEGVDLPEPVFQQMETLGFVVLEAGAKYVLGKGEEITASGFGTPLYHPFGRKPPGQQFADRRSGELYAFKSLIEHANQFSARDGVFRSIIPFPTDGFIS